MSTARELDTGAYNVESYVKRHPLSGFSEMLMSISGSYISDSRVKKTIREVVQTICKDGYVVLVGRGGVAITRDMERSLHIMLEAPLEWRAIRMAEKYCMTEKEAAKHALETDRKRREMRDYFHGKGTDYTRFDIRYNCMTLSIGDIVESIVSLMQARNFV